LELFADGQKKLQQRRENQSSRKGCRLAEWQEGSVLSSLDAITRLHQRAMSA
jgi:hypothetical protein